jgi:hypothetical protein
MGFTALIAAGVGAAGSLGAAAINSNAATTASSQQVAEQKQALAQQQAMYNQGLGTASNALNPFINAGQSVLPTLQGLLTPGTSASTLSQMPGFQFQSQYGTQAATNALAARTGPSAGPLAAAISQYNNGLAGTTWQNTVNALQGYANTGANAAGTFGTAALGGAINSGNSQAATLTNTGNALASGTLGSAAALSGGLTGAAGSAQNALIYNQLFGKSGPGGIYEGTSSVGGAPLDGYSGVTPGSGGGAYNPYYGPGF